MTAAEPPAPAPAVASTADRRSAWSRAGRAATGYAGVVFAAGFVLGVGRTLVFAPAVGARAAELIETPVMLGVVWIAARWTVERAGHVRSSPRLATGVMAVAMLLLAEGALVRLFGEQTPRQWLLERDPVLAVSFGASMLFMAAAPVLVRAGGGQRTTAGAVTGRSGSR